MKLTKRKPPPCWRRKGGKQNTTSVLYQKGMENAMIDFENRELGGGSYPEPPDTPETERPVCEECGDDYAVREINGHQFCQTCLQDYYKKAYHDWFWEFINSNPVDKLNFTLKYWLPLLPKEEQADILIHAFKEYYSVPFQWGKYQFEHLLDSYVEDNTPEFADYMDRQEGARRLTV